MKQCYLKNIIVSLVFGIIIALVTLYVDSVMQYNSIHLKVQENALFVSKDIRSYIQRYLDRIDKSLEAINTNQLFLDYISNPTDETTQHVHELFINTMQNNQNFFQCRFIDANGMEKVRIERDRRSDRVFVVKGYQLQDKSDRYYFSETMYKNNGKYRHSKFDLNMERGEIEEPVRPTFRVSTKVIYKDKNYGMLIVNIEMQELLSYVEKYQQFNTYLIDQEGYFILHPNSEKSWSRYLKTPYSVYTEWPERIEKGSAIDNISENHHLYSLEDLFNNDENIRLVLATKSQYLQEIQESNVKFLMTLGMVLLISSVLIGCILSLLTSGRCKEDPNRCKKEA